MRNIKQFREKLGFTQEEFGALFKQSRQTYNNIENGKRKGSAKFWLSVQKKFNLTADETLELLEVKQM